MLASEREVKIPFILLKTVFPRKKNPRIAISRQKTITERKLRARIDKKEFIEKNPVEKNSATVETITFKAIKKTAIGRDGFKKESLTIFLGFEKTSISLKAKNLPQKT